MNQQLDTLATSYWDVYLEASPTQATLLGDHRFDHVLEHLNNEKLEDYKQKLRKIISETEAIDRASLEHQDELTRDLLIAEATNQIEWADTRVLVAPIDQFGPHATLQIYSSQLTLGEPEHAEALLERYAQIPRLFDEMVIWNRQELAAGRPPVAANVQRVLDQLDGYLSSPIDGDPFLNTQPPAGWNGAEPWQEKLRNLIVEQIRPAHAHYRDGVADLRSSARSDDQPGLSHVTDGEEIYSRLVSTFTSLSVAPAEIHRIGLEEAQEKLPTQFAEIGERLFGITEPSAVLERLRNDLSLRYETPAQMLRHAEETVARAWEAAPGWFGLAPKAPCEVIEIQPAIAKDLPPAFYTPPAEDGSRPGTYHVNTSNPGDRNRFETESVAFHEAVPGHHFQIALSQELQGIPAFRRHALMIPYAEGWGLYTERLADEMGLYSTDLDRLGMLSADAWRAGRLVVDTGLHYHGWTRQQAIDFLTEWSAVAPLTIAQEVDRYIGWPGQALAYKMGQREILRLRADAKSRLGDNFDIKRFHDLVLGSGPLTLPILARVIEEGMAP
jgi:uncharacterized protein (DUF885 family)